jgi:hypothetical protein
MISFCLSSVLFLAILVTFFGSQPVVLDPIRFPYDGNLFLQKEILNDSPFWAAAFFLLISVYWFLSVVSPYLPITPSPHYLLAVSGHFVLLV